MAFNMRQSAFLFRNQTPCSATKRNRQFAEPFLEGAARTPADDGHLVRRIGTERDEEFQ